MGTKAGQLLWNRKRFSVAEGAHDVDTGLVQQNLIFDSPSEPKMGVTRSDATPPAPGALPPSRIMVIPLAPTANWAGITHSEPYVDSDTGTVHVTFTNANETTVEINCLFWDPHSLIGPGLADTYNAAD